MEFRDILNHMHSYFKLTRIITTLFDNMKITATAVKEERSTSAEERNPQEECSKRSNYLISSCFQTFTVEFAIQSHRPLCYAMLSSIFERSLGRKKPGKHFQVQRGSLAQGTMFVGKKSSIGGYINFNPPRLRGKPQITRLRALAKR